MLEFLPFTLEMSFNSQSVKGRLAFASKTSFDLLASPDHDEESDHEEAEQERLVDGDLKAESTQVEPPKSNIERYVVFMYLGLF